MLFKGFFDTSEFKILFFLILMTVIAGTVFYNQAEGWSMLDSLYFSVITLTTVGYGDFSPQTDIGKAFTIAFVFIGIAFILMFFNHVARYAHENALKEVFTKKTTISKSMKKKLKKSEV